MQSEKYNKLPSQLSVDDLIEAANKQETFKEVLEASNDVIIFLTHFGLQQGAFPVNKRVLYKLYRQWSKDPVSRKFFALETGKYLFLRQIGKNDYYLINKDSFKLERKSFALLSKKRDKRKSPHFVQHFNNFLVHNAITQGKVYIPSYALHKVYKDWCKRMGKKPALSYNALFQFFELQFKSKRIETSKGKAFGVNENIWIYITKNEIETIKEARKKQSKVKNKKRSLETPS